MIVEPTALACNQKTKARGVAPSHIAAVDFNPLPMTA